jgi:HEAT repeat protein/CheY-like chemotaxis protein
MKVAPLLGWTAALAFTLAAGLLAAQDPFDPFADAPAAPFGGAAKPAAAAPAAAEEAASPISADEQDPVVRIIRERNPTTPAELMFAVQSLFDIGRPEEAKFYLGKLLAAQPDRDQLEAFQREHGTGFFLRMANERRMQPEAEQFAKLVQDAAYEAARDPQRLQTLVQQASDPSPLVRARAVEELQRAGQAAVTPLLQALADPARQAEHPAMRDAVVALGQGVSDPLLGALETPDKALRFQVLQVLGRQGTARAIPFLIGPAFDSESGEAARRAAAETLAQIVGSAPSRTEAVAYLTRRVREYLNGAVAGTADYQDNMVFWHWDAASQTSVPRTYTAAEASRMMAARLSRDLIQLAPENRDVRRLFLLANLSHAKIAAGLDQPLPRGEGTLAARAAALGLEPLEDALAYAMQHDYPAAAQAAAELLGELGDETLVRSDSGQPRPLVQALRHSDRRLRLAAADAIMKLDPRRPYPGSSYLPETLGYFIRTLGSRRALVAQPRAEKAQTLVGLLNQIGYSADAAGSGRETFQLAIKQPDYEFLLISDAVDSLNANETIQMFRKDPLTARLPIGLMARQENQRQAEAIAELDPQLIAFPRPHDVRSMSFQVSRLADLAGSSRVGYDARLDQAARALEHLTRLAERQQERTFYDMFRVRQAIAAALETPGLSGGAARVLGLLGCPESQRELVLLASQHARPLAERQAAAEAFAQAVQRRGVLLTRDEITLQYDRYNRSAALDVGTQQVLGAILDAIEQPSRQCQEEEDLTQGSVAAGAQPKEARGLTSSNFARE